MADKERFIKTYSKQGMVVSTEIWVDTETGVNYVFHKDGYAGGLTPLLDKDGKPVVTLNEVKN
ncbi:MAG: xylan 1,4-beta-xylosidase [Oscillospiraceae bacterium]|nr:xylan 1,4-beta-xylosidase [Oscillospiraceae bacterium]